MYLGGQLALCTYLLGLGWEKSHTKKILVQNLCCLLYRKAFGGLRVRTRWWIMYLEKKNLCYLLSCKALDETRVTTRNVSGEELVLLIFIVRPSVGRGLRLDDVSCILSNYRNLLTCKVLGGTRLTIRKCLLRIICVVYLIVRPSVGRGLRLDDVSCMLVGQMALFTYL